MKNRRKFKMIILEMKLEPVKLCQYFRMSIREFKGTVCQLACTLAEERDTTIFLNDVIHLLNLFDWSEVSDLLFFHLQTFQHTRE